MRQVGRVVQFHVLVTAIVIVAACATGGGRPPVPPPQPPPTEYVRVPVRLYDLQNPALGIPNVTVQCSPDYHFQTDANGEWEFEAVSGLQIDCVFEREGYDRQRASLVPDGTRRLETWMHRVFTPAPPLGHWSVEDNKRWFRTEHGRVDYREYSAFPLLGMIQHGREDLTRENLRGARAQKFTVARVFLAYRYNGPYPSGPDQPNFYPSLDRLFQIAAEEGMHLRLGYIAATEPWGGVWHPDRRDIWSGAVRAGGEAFVRDVARHICGREGYLAELANEPLQIGLRSSFDALVDLGKQVEQICPSQVLSAGAVDGPNEGNTSFLRAPFDYADSHLWRLTAVGGFEWVKRSGEQPLIDQSLMPFVSGEPINFVEGRDNDSEQSPSVAFAYAAVSRARQYNTNYHFDGGLYGRLPEERSRASVECYHAGLDAFPMNTDSKWRGHWGLPAGDYWKDVWPNTDSTREVEEHINRGRGPWRAFGAGRYSVVFPEPDGWDWRSALDAPAELIGSCDAGAFQASVYRRQ